MILSKFSYSYLGARLRPCNNFISLKTLNYILFPESTQKRGKNYCLISYLNMKNIKEK